MSEPTLVNPWTEAETDRLFEMAKEGHSFRVISGEIGRSRNACIGHYHREASRRGHVIPQRVLKRDVTVEKPKPSLASTANVIRLRPPPPAPVRLSPAVGILDVTGCKFPVAENADLIGGYEFCNHKRDGERVYCEHHAAVAFRKFIPKPGKSLPAIGLRFHRGAA